MGWVRIVFEDGSPPTRAMRELNAQADRLDRLMKPDYVHVDWLGEPDRRGEMQSFEFGE
jgi:hypothetical protein